MGEPGATVQRSFRAPRDLVWALLADTNRYDRALGMSIPRYAWRDVDGARRLVGQATQGGMAIEWIEHPYEWVEGRFLSGRREFIGGPALDGGLRIDVAQGSDATQCTARVRASGHARWWWLKMLGPALRHSLQRRLDAYVDDVTQLVEDDALVARLRDAHGNLPSVERVQELLLLGDSSGLQGTTGVRDKAELKRRARRLEEGPVSPAVVRRLIAFLADRPDEEVAQIRPFELARAWGLPRRDVLRGFLYATQAGLVDLNWQINCPVCRVSAAVVDSLAEVGRDVHCQSCNIAYAVAFGDNVEAVFRCNASVRDVTPTVYCASSPTFRPHVLAQLRVEPGASRNEAVVLGAQGVQARTLGGQRPAKHEADVTPATLRIEVDQDQVRIEAEGQAPLGAATDVVMSNGGSEPVYVVLERAGWSAEAVLGSVVASMTEFVDLFATEAPAAGLELSIGRLTLLFSDLTGSTALYGRVGDARAFAVVQEHFALVTAAVERNGGAIVKTMGDAVMATFASTADAVKTAIEAVQQTRAHHEDLEIGVKVGVHEGACLAVRANDRLDFFGTTVNLAARLQGQAATSELVVMAQTLDTESVSTLLQDLPRRCFDADLKGIEGRQPLVGIDLSDAASPWAETTSAASANTDSDP